MIDRKEKILDFLKEIEKFKLVKRETYLSNLENESDSDHVWHLCMFILLFEKEFNDINILKAIKIAMIHDLGEIYSGDIFAFSKEKSEKKNKEKEGVIKILSKLPEDLREEYYNLYLEYENQETEESKLVKAMDKIQPMLQNICSKGKSWEKHNISAEEIDNYKMKYLKYNKLFNDLYKTLRKEALDKKLLKENHN
ncbi:HD domain-containing protein [Candidatus Woesearchaeota archaeon]|nr:HD domain-containing protein [Candidatus Woesearchaeota archaeon]